MPILQSAFDSVSASVVLDIAITALLIYWLFSLIRGTRAVRLVVGVGLLILVYGAAVTLDLRLLTVILQTGAYVGLFALVVIFQPELRRALDRIGRLGSIGRLVSGAELTRASHVADQIAEAAARLSRDGQGALIVIERETGLQEIAETGVMIHGDVSADLLVTVFSPRTPLHDGAVVVRGDTILAAGALLPSAVTTIPVERFGTRHKAALGITEQTDALVVVVSEESGQISLVERARIVRNLDEAKLVRALTAQLHPVAVGGGLLPTRLELRHGGPVVRELARRARFGRPQPKEEAARPAEQSATPAGQPATPAGQPASTAEQSATPAGQPASPAKRAASPRRQRKPGVVE